MLEFMFIHYTFGTVGLLSGHLLGNSCLLGLPFVLIVFYLFGWTKFNYILRELSLAISFQWLYCCCFKQYFNAADFMLLV